MKPLSLFAIGILLFSSCAIFKPKNTCNNVAQNNQYIKPSKFSGHGHVEKFKHDSGMMLIRLGGPLIKGDTAPVAYASFVVAHGKFAKMLKNYTNQTVKFECEALYSSSHTEEILYTVSGCVENVIKPTVSTAHK